MAQTTLMPFNALPPCALDCYKLFDANGACVPPAKPAADLGTYASCFCADARVSALAVGTAGVCPETACAGVPGGLESIHTWFSTFCAENAQQTQPTTTPGGAGSQGSSGSTSSQGPGGDWISMHWRWVIFIVVVVLGIIGIWVGACVWRRRYLRKKDRQYALGKAARYPSAAAQSQRSVHLPQAGLFAPASISAANVYDIEKTTEAADRANGGRRLSRSKKDKKKWVVSERT